MTPTTTRVVARMRSGRDALNVTRCALSVLTNFVAPHAEHALSTRSPGVTASMRRRMSVLGLFGFGTGTMKNGLTTGDVLAADGARGRAPPGATAETNVKRSAAIRAAPPRRVLGPMAGC